MMTGRCLAVLPDDETDEDADFGPTDAAVLGGMSFVKVADFGPERILFFSADKICMATGMSPPAEWQTRAIVDASSGSIARDYFPPKQDYSALFVLALALLPFDILASKPRLLIVGGGGGLLATLYRQTIPNAVIDVVEPSKAVLTLAQRYFGLQCAGATRCHQELAQDFVHLYSKAEPKPHNREMHAPYDLIVLDAFENDGDESSTPRAWSRREWCSKLAARLHTGHGVLAANLYSADETSAPFRSHCDMAFAKSGGSRIILEPGISRSSTMPQTVEAWSPCVELSALKLQQRAEAVLRLRDPASAAQLSQRAVMAWRGQVTISHGRDGGLASSSTLEQMPIVRNHRSDWRHTTVSLWPSGLAIALGLTFYAAVALARAAGVLTRRLNQRSFLQLIACAVALVVGYGVVEGALAGSLFPGLAQVHAA